MVNTSPKITTDTWGQETWKEDQHSDASSQSWPSEHFAVAAVAAILVRMAESSEKC